MSDIRKGAAIHRMIELLRDKPKSKASVLEAMRPNYTAEEIEFAERQIAVQITLGKGRQKHAGLRLRQVNEKPT